MDEKSVDVGWTSGRNAQWASIAKQQKREQIDGQKSNTRPTTETYQIRVMDPPDGPRGGIDFTMLEIPLSGLHSTNLSRITEAYVRARSRSVSNLLSAKAGGK